ncbi:MAG: hypothetical protein HYY15_02350 [Candidatus Omnitrophica bacterium]|nr:hypothetical protein [Candidatus Omnitrophota bacterium]
MLTGWFTVLGWGLLLIGALAWMTAWRRPLLAKLRGMLLGMLLMGVGGLSLGLGLALRSFEAFSTSTVIAQVRCRWTGPKAFELTWVPVTPDAPGQPLIVPLRGDQWAISGGVVKWHPWLTALGLPSYHRPTRLSGRYATASEEAALPPSAVAIGPEPGLVWWWFYQLDPYLPFVDAVYGSTAFAYVNPAVPVEVAVTPSGYLVQRARTRPSDAAPAGPGF